MQQILKFICQCTRHCALALFVVAFIAVPLFAQTGGEAGIQGTVTDPTGAAIPNATVTATNVATGVAISRQTSGDGLYTISPIIPGTYSVHVVVAGFSDYLQNNLKADALVLTPLNIAMKVGTVGSEVTVDTAPPALETNNATLGLTIENETYSNLPLTLNNAQRDATAFAALAPGAQGGARLPIIGGTGNYLGQLYLDGLPAQTISQQGDNRLVSQALDVDAVDQIQVVTSTPPAEYSGAGAANFTVKSGGLKYHGQVADFIRNTAFDVAGFTSKVATFKNAAGATQLVGVPIDHQNEFSATFGGHVPGTHRVFFFVAYDKYHSRTVATPASYTIATPLERTGDFTELNCPSGTNAIAGCIGTGLTGEGANNPAFLFDPTSTTCVAGGACTRTPFMGLKNGVPTYNVIPTGYLSPFALKAQSFLPAPTNPSVLLNNYSAGLPGGFDNHAIDYRVDFDINPKHRLSAVGAFGAVNYLNNYGAPYLPQPYTGGDLANIFPKNFDVEDAYTISNSMVNQFKFGFTRFYQNIHNSTAGVSQYEIGTLGATNLPAGQAGVEFPGISFGTNTAGLGAVANALTTYTTNSNSTATQITTPNNFTLVDNLQYTRGAHSITAGITIQWQEINNANPATYTGILSLSFNPADTSQFTGTSLTTTGSTGNSYASYLLGAVGGTPSLGLQPVAEVGGRYRPIAPYLEDTWKVNHKLTVDGGIRWDYLPPYREVKDRWSFLNPTLTNTASGNLGALEFAGSYGGAGVSCGCRTPINTYYANYGPRLGITYAFTDKTVFRGGIGRVFSQGGGVGGRGGAYQGTGQLGFNVTATGPAETLTGGAAAAPSFYLNNGATFTSLGIANTSLFGAGYAYPTAPTPSAASQTLDTGNYVNPATGKFVTASAAPGYADPYFSGRAPDFTFFNVGVEQAFSSTLTVGLNYVGNQSHHLYNSTSGGANIRGYWANQLNPIYLAGLGGTTDSTNANPILSSPATPVNVAKAQSVMSGVNIPASFQAAAAAGDGAATIAQGLTAFPQYSSVADTYGVNTANFSYNSLQFIIQQRQFHGLTYNVNYTWSHNIGDDGTFRSGFDIPAAAISNGTQSYHQDRIERGYTVGNLAHNVHAFGVYQLPFGKGRLGGQNWISRELFGGWQLSFIYTYTAGTPAALVATGCNSPGQGQCMPDLNTAYSGSPRINGSFGKNADGSRNACAIGQGTGCASAAVKYFDYTAFQSPRNLSPLNVKVTGVNLLGNAPRTHPLGLSNPGAQNIDTGLHKTIPIHERMNLVIEGDCFNTWNHTIFSAPNSTIPFTNLTTAASVPASAGTFGQISSVANKPRSFELAAHFNF